VNIELKSYETADKVVDLIEHCGQILELQPIHSFHFDWNALQQVVF
jgi:hypothetical protein